MSRIFEFLYSYFENRRLILFSIFILLILFFVYTSSKINFRENIVQMLPQKDATGQLSSFMENSKFSDRIMMVVSDTDTSTIANPDSLVVVATQFIDSLKVNFNDYIESINYRSDDSSMSQLVDVVNEHLPVFMDDDDYRKIDSLISETQVQSKVESNYHTLISLSGIVLKQFITNDPLGLGVIPLKKFESFKGDEDIVLYDGYYFSNDGHHLFLFINPKYGSGETDKNIRFFENFDQLVNNILSENKNINIHYFGAPVVAAGNSKQIRKDTSYTITLSVIILLFVFFLFFRKWSSPLLVMIPVLFGGLFALTCIYFVKGGISIISLGAGSLVLGIAVNYSLHFLTHNRYHPGIRQSIKELAFPMTAGSLTTIGGFLCLQFVDAPVLQDLGLFAALSLAGAAIATLVFLPHLISKENKSVEIISTRLFRNISGKINGNKNLALFILLLTPVFIYFAGDIKFESDMYKINYMSDEVKASEIFVNRFSTYYRKSIFTLSGGNTFDEALKADEKNLGAIQQLKLSGKIITSSNVSSVLPSHEEQTRRIEKWNSYWSEIKTTEVYNRLINAGKQFNFSQSAFDPFKNMVRKEYFTISDANEEFLKNTILNNFIEENNGKYTVIGLIKTTPEHTSEIYSSFGQNENTIVFDRQQITDKLVAVVSDEFNFITLWTSLLVFIALLIIYGRIELALISFIPMVLSWIWILGIMSIFDIHFNIINIILSTLIFALGDDYCIFTTDGLQQAYARKTKTLQSTSVSIALSAFTTVTGMGVLIFAEHPALNSIALVSIIGILSVWIMSQIFQPILFRFFITSPTSQGHEPYTFFNILKSIFAFSYFILGSLLISAIGIVMFKLTPGKSARKKYLYHVIMSRFAWSMIYIMGNVKKKVINETGEDFSKPAVIIANHSSFLDILLLIMLHPKLILLTNKWVWNSPVFGMAVRLAEYYPVAEGAENTTVKLAEKVAEGYSIVVFPEGTRSSDGKIGRFHKGAFYLAENLKIDILPILIHGANYTMSKGFFYLKNGYLTLKFLPRIKFDDVTYGPSYKEKAKIVGKYFREQHNLLREDVETTDYFKSMLFSNFLFKGPVLEWYMKIKVKLENNYRIFDELVPPVGKITDIGCGYGFLSYMLGYTSINRSVLGIDYDEDKIQIAQNAYLKKKNVNFIHANAGEFINTETDVFILNDVLHYMEPDEQEKLLQNCCLNLSANGMMIIRDGVKELETRHLGTRVTELFSTRLLGFNKTKGKGLSFISGNMIRDFAKSCGLTVTEFDSARYTSNIIFVLKKVN